MTSKESLDIIKQRVNTIRLNTKIGSRRIADEENAILLDHIEYNLNKLCELVERDTPKKVYSTDYHYCPNPNCGTHHLRKYQRCCDWCGQRLDWSKKNE